MKNVLRITGSLAVLLLMVTLVVFLALSLRGRAPEATVGSAIFQSPIRDATSTPAPPERGTQTPSPVDAAICAQYPTPPYPISLTPCPYYLTPPPEPIVIFTPAPRPTPDMPGIILGSQIAASEGSTFRPVYISKDYTGSGELCDMRPSPDGQKIALNLCNTEGMSLIVIASVHDSKAVGGAQGGWFRGWFPDSNQWLLMDDHLQILSIATDESRRITPVGETVTDAAVSPDGKTIAYTIIQGDRLKLIDTDGNLLLEILSPKPKPGDRPEGITWSADGQFIAYVWDKTVIQFNSFGPLWVVETKTSKQWQLSPDNVFDSFPTWAPVGHRILVVRRENIDDRSTDFDLSKLKSNLWVVDTDMQEWRQLTDFKGQGAWSPVWSPDGSAVVFMSNMDDRLNGWLINIDDHRLQQLTFDSPLMPRVLSVIP